MLSVISTAGSVDLEIKIDEPKQRLYAMYQFWYAKDHMPAYAL